MKRKLGIMWTILILLIVTCGGAFAEDDVDMKILVKDESHEVVFALNDTLAAKTLYDQLPLEIEVDNYGTNEKIFYPPEKLDGTDAIETGGAAGGLAYFSPWGNVVMFYSAFDQYPGLYVLGEAISGAEQISQLSGTIRVMAYEPQAVHTSPSF